MGYARECHEYSPLLLARPRELESAVYRGVADDLIVHVRRHSGQHVTAATRPRQRWVQDAGPFGLLDGRRPRPCSIGG